MKLHVISTILLVGACGGSDLDPGSGNDTGDGTNTLVVDGDASAQSELTNGRISADFNTEFSIRITLNGVQVTTGDVTVTSSSGTVALLFDTQDNGRWRGNAPGYDEVYVLDVTSGPDSVTGVRVDGPDIHTFDAPVAGATVDSTMPLDVTWSRDDHADQASIDTDEIDALSIDDSGAHTLPPGTLKTEQDKARQNTIRVTRSNRIAPAGAAGGSTWAVSVRNTIDVLAAAAP